MKSQLYDRSIAKHGLKLLNKAGQRFVAGIIRRLCCGINLSNWVLFYFILLYVAFLALGAVGFSYFEEPVERELQRQLDFDIRSFTSGHLGCINETALALLLERIILAHNRGVSPHFNTTTEPNWSFGQAFFFSGTVVTTIGYGHVTPLSREGKLFCIFYAAIGIPLTFTLFAALVERLLIPLNRWQTLLALRLPGCSMQLVRIIHVTILGIVVLVFVFMLPALAFYAVEPGWDFLDSLYYCFISLTTIGLGDFVPGDAPNQVYRAFYKIVAMLYLLVGLTFLMLFIEVFISIPGFNLATFLSRAKYSTEEPEETNDVIEETCAGSIKSRVSISNGPDMAKANQTKASTVEADLERLPITYNRGTPRKPRLAFKWRRMVKSPSRRPNEDTKSPAAAARRGTEAAGIDAVALRRSTWKNL
ncbi:unnamed protein product [Notodromas monacha]|uniref:Potassium channel domain-containing protein n=1 Tax=Notodromas monacha TaxID=399045 RepID=A0A7R9BBX0_9CRUS|nr:unnamed protein product [Notodromas monacha]CAG0912462.1 unnamed protein product [Notodromas monacha]